MKEEDSFEQYKGELEKELGISNIKPPTKPMNAYMRYFLERSSQERAKGQSNFNELSSTIAAQWNNLADNKRDFYQQIYQIRSRERDALLVQYDLLSNQHKVLSPYSRFIKKRYLQYSKQYKSLSSLQITKLANEDWKKLSLKEKDRLKQQFQQEKIDLQLNIDRSDQISEYLTNLQSYHNRLEEEKNKILRKYGLTAQHKAQIKLDTKERKLETKKMLHDIRIQFQKANKKKYREQVKLKKRKEKQRISKIANEQRQQQQFALKAQRARIRMVKAEMIKYQNQAKKDLEKLLNEQQKVIQSVKVQPNVKANRKNTEIKVANTKLLPKKKTIKKQSNVKLNNHTKSNTRSSQRKK